MAVRRIADHDSLKYSVYRPDSSPGLAQMVFIPLCKTRTSVSPVPTIGSLTFQVTESGSGSGQAT